MPIIGRRIDFFWDQSIGPVLVIIIRNQPYGLCLCHRLEERSIWFFGLERYLCARCIGLLLGGLIGISIFRLGFQLPVVTGLLFLIPMTIDGLTQAFGLRESTNSLRVTTGFLFGLGMPPMLSFLFSLVDF